MEHIWNRPSSISDVIWHPVNGYCKTSPKSWYLISIHYGDVIMGTIASQITSLAIVYPAIYSDADQRKHQSPASQAFVREIHRRPVHWNENVIILMKSSSLAAPKVVKMTTFGAASDETFIKMMTFSFQCEFPAQMASNAENVSIWWRHHVMHMWKLLPCVMITISYFNDRILGCLKIYNTAIDYIFHRANHDNKMPNNTPVSLSCQTCKL